MKESGYQIVSVDLKEQRLAKIRVMICQLDFDQMQYEKDSRLIQVKGNLANQAFLRRFLNIAMDHRVDLLVFPELTIPEEFIRDLKVLAEQYKMYIIGGTHYKKTEKGFISICPIITPYGVYETEKINPASPEISSFKGGSEGVISGQKVLLFTGTKLGAFTVNICLDYIDDNLRCALGKDNLDLLIVTAFNNKSDEFFFSMQTDVQRSQSGLYLIYCNAYSNKTNSEGRSALFAFMDEVFKSEFIDKKRTDSQFPNKIYELSADKSYCIFELDLNHKKPLKGKNVYTETNVKVIEEDDADKEKRYEFLEAIKVNEEKYKYVDQFYVKPQEYQEMSLLLEREHILVITGDPGIGKTYSAINFLREYFLKGLKPVWLSGMDKDGRDKQNSYLLKLDPQPNQIVYIEDPFGRIVFENREELQSVFSDLVQKFRNSKSKLIITSRSEIFKQFQSETLQGQDLLAFEKKMNVRKPSYSKDALITIAKHYIRAFANWGNKPRYVSTIIRGIYSKRLISPLMIHNLIRNNARVRSLKLLKSAVDNAKTDLISQFAQEMRSLTIPTLVLLFMVFLRCGKKNIIRDDVFEKIQASLAARQSFNISTFDYELRGQEGYRIQRIGTKMLSYRFSHPTYEEAVAVLAEKDQTCSLVFDTVLSVLLQEDISLWVILIKRFVNTCPNIAERLLKSNSSLDFSVLSEQEKLEITWGMQASSRSYLKEVAQKMYPIEDILNGLYSNDCNPRFYLRLSSLEKRKDEIDMEIEWKKVFSKAKIKQLRPEQFLLCYKVASLVEPQLIDKIQDNFEIEVLVAKYLLLPTEKSRLQLNEYLKTTRYSGLLSELKDLFPQYVVGDRHSGHPSIKRVVKQYMFNRHDPRGCIIFDDGTTDAILFGSELYPIGVKEVIGEFKEGDIVCFSTVNKRIKAKCVVQMSSSDIRQYQGLHLSEIIQKTNNQKINNVITKRHLWLITEKSPDLYIPPIS